jgi:hypothetical protein
MMRHLSPELRTFFDSRITIPDVKTPNQVLLAAAKCMVGISDEQAINLFRSIITKPWNEPWCADFAQSCIAYAEVTVGCQSPIGASEGVLDMWDKSPHGRNVGWPGDLIIWRHRGSQTEGHCGIITGGDASLWETVEGNTTDSQDIERIGTGVFAKKRTKGGTKTFEEVGFLVCFP